MMPTPIPSPEGGARKAQTSRSSREFLQRTRGWTTTTSCADDRRRELNTPHLSFFKDTLLGCQIKNLFGKISLRAACSINPKIKVCYGMY